MDEQKNQNSETPKGVGVETEVIKLLREFFTNKTSLRKIKRDRIEYRSKNNCTNFIAEEGDCIMRQAEEYCEVCKKRNELHQEILRLNYRNNGILTSLRAKVL